MSHDLSPVVVDQATFTNDPATWFADQGSNAMPFLLAQCDDGVIWGRWHAGVFAFSGNAFPEVSPLLRSVTLQRARVFGPGGELLVWRAAQRWQARKIQGDGDLPATTHLLWGSHVEGRQGGFTLVREGSEGLRHAIPMVDLVVANNDVLTKRVVLDIRRDSALDADGQIRIAQSWLTGLRQLN